MVPKNLFLVRHGESEGNVATRQVKRGDGALMAQLNASHTKAWRLSPLGRQQAQTAGAWLKEQLVEPLGAHYVSSYARARETAGLLDLPNAHWYQHLSLREREWGQMSSLSPEERIHHAHELQRLKRDGMFGAPLGGESIHDVIIRVQRFIDMLVRKYSDQSVVVVCHGEVMWAFRIILERMTEERYRLLDESQHAFDRIHNCQIIQYARWMGNDDVMERRYERMRSICPSDFSLSNNEWQRIVRPSATNEELLAGVEQYPCYMTE